MDCAETPSSSLIGVESSSDRKVRAYFKCILERRETERSTVKAYLNEEIEISPRIEQFVGFWLESQIKHARIDFYL